MRIRKARVRLLLPADAAGCMTIYSKLQAIPVLLAAIEVIDVRWISLRDHR